jgi:hypothetical protein
MSCVVVCEALISDKPPHSFDHLIANASEPDHAFAM